MPVSEFSIVRASQLTIPNKDWTHYRLGLKLSCTDNTAGVTISVVSQGRPIVSDKRLFQLFKSQILRHGT